MNRNGDYLGIISMPGTEMFSSKVDYYLKLWHNTDRSFVLSTSFPRFTTGDAKVVLDESIRGKDIFIISDPNNYAITYKMRGIVNHMSPDDHFQDIIRVISAANGKAHRISTMITMLYGARQHGRNMRESLDCAMALRELESIGVKNIITFDAHDPRVQNAVPLVSFDNLYPNYQMVKALVRTEENLNLSNRGVTVIAPDAGGVQRCLKLAESLNLEIGMFYKQRNTRFVTNGNNVIERHEFIGNDLNGKDVILVDDILATGGSMIDSFYELKKLGVRRIFSFVTFGMFTEGYKEFDRAYADGAFDRLYITNLTYHEIDGVERPYIIDVDLSKYAAYIINSIYEGTSISNVLNPSDKIHDLLHNDIQGEIMRH